MWIPSAKVAIGIGAVTAAVYYAGKWAVEKYQEALPAMPGTAPGLRIKPSVLDAVRERFAKKE